MRGGFGFFARGPLRSGAVLVLGLLGLLELLFPSGAFAHSGEPLAPHDLWGAWSWDPGVVVGLALSGGLYLLGVRALWGRVGVGRGVRRWEAGCYAAGWGTLFVALVSPLHPLGEVLFSAHMVQHELIMAVAAPLLVLGRPLIPFLWALPIGWRRRLGGVGRVGAVRGAWHALVHPWTAWALQAAALWIWHLPGPYQATLRSDWVHALQHLCFLFSSLLFWWTIVHAREGRMGYGGALFSLFTTLMHTGGLGALLTFASRVWYPAYHGTTAAWGLTPLEDQQLAGLIMWIPAGIGYLAAGLALFAAWMRESERRTTRREALAVLRPVV